METIHPLKDFRDKQVPRLTQKQLAVLLGVTRTTIARWETGAHKLDEDLVPKVSEKTGIAPEELRPDLARLFERPNEAPGDEPSPAPHEQVAS